MSLCPHRQVRSIKSHGKYGQTDKDRPLTKYPYHANAHVCVLGCCHRTPSFLPCPANQPQSTAASTKVLLESLLMVRRRGVLGPAVGKQAVMWVDDINAGGRDVFATQASLEVLRHWCHASGWHDESNNRLKRVEDTHLFTCFSSVPYGKP